MAERAKYLVIRGNLLISGHKVPAGDVIEMGDDEVGQLVRQHRLVKLPDRIASKIDADVVTATSEPEPEPEPEPGYEDLTVPELRKLLAERDLPTEGKKTELLERLQAS